MWTIARREWRALFVSPLAWTLLAVVQGLLAWTFFSQVEEYLRLQPKLVQLATAPGVTRLVVGPYFLSAAVLAALVVPLLTMRLIAGERREGTLDLLLSAPIPLGRVVLGKYLGALGFLLVLWLPAVAMPASLALGTELDWGMLAAGALGFLLALAAFTAVGLYTSALASQPATAATTSYGLLLLLWLAGSAGGPDNLLADLSPLVHLRSLVVGLVQTPNLAYFALLTLACLALAMRRLDDERVGG